jgi:opacity protein-like surface antigen
MIVRSLRVFTAGVIFTFATGAQAQGQDPKLWYVAVGAGAAWSSGLSVTGTTTGTINTDPGFNVSGAFGRYIGDIKVIRLEGEVLYFQGNVSNISGTGAGGDLSSASLMFNAFYDFNTDSNWTPFIGGGIGYSHVSFNDLSVGGVTLIDDSSDAFSWQFKAGVSYQFTPSVSINGSYRLYATDNLSFKDSAGASVNSEGMLTQSAEIGVRFHF